MVGHFFPIPNVIFDSFESPACDQNNAAEGFDVPIIGHSNSFHLMERHANSLVAAFLEILQNTAVVYNSSISRYMVPNVS